MSVRTMSLVFEYDMPELKTDDGKTVPDSTAKFVLIALADHCNDEGEGAYPGVKRICKKTSMSSQTVCNALNALRHNGYTTQMEEKSKSGTNNYTINMDKLFQPLGFQPLESHDSSGWNPPILATRVKPSINHQINHQEEDEALAKISKAYEAEIGNITYMVADDIQDVAASYPLKWVLDAIHESAAHNKRSWKYVTAILRRWKAQGNQEPMKKQAAQSSPRPATNFDQNMDKVRAWLEGDTNV